MKFSSVIFWDCDRTIIDCEKNARYVISRVVMYGSLDDWKSIKQLYGLDRIRNELLQEKDIDPKTHHFISIIFDIPKEKFRCYLEKQYQLKHWIY